MVVKEIGKDSEGEPQLLEQLLQTAEKLKTKFKEAKLNMEGKLDTLGIKMDQSFVIQFIELYKELDIMCKIQDLKVKINPTSRSSREYDDKDKEIGKLPSVGKMNEGRATKEKAADRNSMQGRVVEGRLE